MRTASVPVAASHKISQHSLTKRVAKQTEQYLTP